MFPDQVGDCSLMGPEATAAAPYPRRALHGAGPPRLVLVREPNQLGVERAHPQLAFGARLVELAEANRHVADDGWVYALGAMLADRNVVPKPG